MTKGFFEVETSKKSARKGTNRKVIGCNACGLYKDCTSPKMLATGKGKKGLLIIAEAPGAAEDRKGEQLVGKIGKAFRRTLAKFDIDLDKDCRKINAINCRPPNNRKPTDKEIDHCRSRVWDEIKSYKPKVILLLGGSALDSFLNHRIKEKPGGITRWRGWTIPDRDVNAWVCPTFHPSYVERTKYDNPAVNVLFEKDIKQAIKKLDVNMPIASDEDKKIKILFMPHDIKKELLKYQYKAPSDKPPYLTFDFETSGLKPHKLGHFIDCCSISTDPNSGIVFPMSDEITIEFKKLMTDKRIKKIAQNIKFENLWTSVTQEFEIENWGWDTQLAAHILDNRERVTDLDFLVYTNFGIIDYSSHIKKFLKGKDEKDSNSFNKIKDVPINEKYLYCGKDGMLAHRLALKQMRLIKKRGLQEAYDLFHEGMLSMIKIGQAGIRIDTEYCKKQKIRLIKKIHKLKKDLESYKEIKLWKKKYGKKFLITSPAQLADILYNELKMEPTELTATGKPSVKQKALESIDLPFIKTMIKLSTLEHTLNTFLAGIIRETVYGYLYPFFHLNTVATYRSSSSKINFQNIPKRNPEVKKLIRQAIIPREGRQLIEIDFKGVEVSVAACVTKDPQLIKYVSDPTTDMHRDMSMQCFDLYEEQVSYWTRYSGKNCFVFPQFYGDYWGSCATALWEAMTSLNLRLEDSGKPMLEHLRSKKLGTYDKFEQHIKRVEHDFWHNRFKVYTKWKEEHIKEYHEKGYFRTLTGFECSGVMDDKQAVNYPIQGPAFHCLLWTLNNIFRIKESENWKSLIINQVHDSKLWDALPEESDHIIKTSKRLVQIELPKAFTWINVPMDVDIEIAPVNKSWYEIKELKAA